MITMYKYVEIDVDNDDIINMVGESTLDVEDVFEEDQIADYCCRHMAVSYIFEHDVILKDVVRLWTKTNDISDEEKAKFLTEIGAQLCEK